MEQEPIDDLMDFAAAKQLLVQSFHALDQIIKGSMNLDRDLKNDLCNARFSTNIAIMRLEKRIENKIRDLPAAHRPSK